MLATKRKRSADIRRSKRIKGLKRSVDTKARMSAAKYAGADKEGTPEWQEAYDQYVRNHHLREILADGIKSGILDIRELDPDDPMVRPYTFTLREISRERLLSGIRNRSLDDHLER